MKVLALVGTGIKTISHLTEESKGYISNCDKVLYLVNEPLLETYIKKIARTTESLDQIYFENKSRENSYKNISDKIHQELQRVNSLCVVIYGHPCVFATPGLLALSTLKNHQDIKTIICPGISSLDCLYADLMFDPANGGIITIDATEYLLYDKPIDTTSHLVIYQIGMIGNLGLPTNKINIDALNFVKNKLLNIYSNHKIAFIYEASLYPGVEPKIDKFRLDELDKQNITAISTLYIPPESKEQIANVDAIKLLNNT